jgi:nitrate reductase gamma subunit
MARATVEKKHLLPVLVTAVVCFLAMGIALQVGKSAIYVGAGIVGIAFAITLVLIIIRRRKNARMMQDILDE